MRLEPELWDALMEICQREALDPGKLVRKIEQQGHAGGRTSAVRVYVLNYFRSATTEEGHAAAGHGTFQGWPEPETAAGFAEAALAFG